MGEVVGGACGPLYDDRGLRRPEHARGDAGHETRGYIMREGGIRQSRVFTKCFMALLGQWPWQDIPTVPVELVLLPPSSPFSIYNFACWARQTVVPLSVMMALRPVRAAGVDPRRSGPGSG